MTLSIDPSQASARNTVEGARFDRTLFSALDALDGAKIPFSLIGGVAASGLGRPRSTHDIDIFLRPEDADAALEALSREGFRTEKTDIKWLFKAFKEDILVDIVFKSSGEIYYDEAMHDRARMVPYHGRSVRVVSPEDLIIIKCAVAYEGGPHHWYDALAVLNSATIDWEYLLQRARRATRRVLALLIYAQSNDQLVPNEIVFRLFHSIFDAKSAPLPPVQAPIFKNKPEASPAPIAGLAPEYLVEHLREALAKDERTSSTDIKVYLDQGQIVLKGECQSPARCHAIEQVIRELAPDHHIDNQIRLSVLGRPEGSEKVL